MFLTHSSLMEFPPLQCGELTFSQYWLNLFSLTHFWFFWRFFFRRKTENERNRKELYSELVLRLWFDNKHKSSQSKSMQLIKGALPSETFLEKFLFLTLNCQLCGWVIRWIWKTLDVNYGIFRPLLHSELFPWYLDSDISGAQWCHSKDCWELTTRMEFSRWKQT